MYSSIHLNWVATQNNTVVAKQTFTIQVMKEAEKCQRAGCYTEQTYMYPSNWWTQLSLTQLGLGQGTVVAGWPNSPLLLTVLLSPSLQDVASPQTITPPPASQWQLTMHRASHHLYCISADFHGSNESFLCFSVLAPLQDSHHKGRWDVCCLNPRSVSVGFGLTFETDSTLLTYSKELPLWS